MTKKKKQMIAVTVILLVLVVSLFIKFMPEFAQRKKLGDFIAYDNSASTSGLIFTNNNFSVGEPITVKVQNPITESSQWEFLWRINGEKISNTENSYTPSEEDNEKIITVTAKSGDETYTATTYISNLPVVFINSEANIGDSYSAANMTMQGNALYDSEQLYQGGISIKLRGNSTKNLDKKPYKIKLDEKSNIFGMGSSKHWVLLANSIDHTFLRNKLVYDFSSEIGNSYATKSDNVILILNGDYQGVYELCEQIRVANNRVDIFDWENLAEDAAKAIGNADDLDSEVIDDLEDALVSDLGWISSPYSFVYNDKSYNISDYVTIPDTTGGFLLEMDFYNLNSGDINSLQTNFSQPFYFNTPENGGTNEALSTYAYDYIQSFEYALHSLDFVYRNSDSHYTSVPGRFDFDRGWSSSTKETEFTSAFNDGLHYSQLFDMTSLVNNFLVCELTVNWDSMKNSVFVTKDIDKLAELGPAWDYDWAFGNDNMFRIHTDFTDIWQTTDHYFTNEQYYQSVQWNRFLIKDPYFLLQVYNKYKEIRTTVLENIIKDGGTLDVQYDYLYQAGIANDNRWSYTYTNYDGKTFDIAYNNLRDFINQRITWLDSQFSSLDSLIRSLGYYKSSDDLSVTSVTYNDDGTALITASTVNPSAASISFEVNGSTFINAPVLNGQASVTVDASILSEKDNNMVQIRLKDFSDNYITNTTNSRNADDVYALSNYKVF